MRYNPLLTLGFPLLGLPRLVCLGALTSVLTFCDNAPVPSSTQNLSDAKVETQIFDDGLESNLPFKDSNIVLSEWKGDELIYSYSLTTNRVHRFFWNKDHFVQDQSNSSISDQASEYSCWTLDLLSIRFNGKDAGIQKVNNELKKFENHFIEEHGTNQLSVSEATFDSLYNFHQMQGTVNVGNCPYRNLAFSLEFECFPIVSIKITSDGGAGGVSWLGMTGSVFNLHTGYRLKLDDVIGVSKDIYLPIIFGKIFDYKQGYDKIYFSDYSDLNTSSRDEFIGTCLEKFDVNDFYLYDGGVVFIFQKYSIGPGAAGCPEFFVRFDQLKELKLIDQNFLKLLESSYYRRPGSQDE